MTVIFRRKGNSMTLEDIAKKLKAARDSGELLQAIDWAQKGAALADDPDDVARMRIDEVILLARAASHREAEEKYRAYKLHLLDHPDAKSLGARLEKDLGLTAEGDARVRHLTTSRDLYLEICRSNDPDWDRVAFEYNGVNAVTLSHFLDDMDPVEDLAAQLAAFAPLPSYYSWATRAEVLMVRAAPAEEVADALRAAPLADRAERLAVLERTPPARALEGGPFYACAGIEAERAAAWIRASRQKAQFPEALRLAHMIAAAVKTGSSRGRV